MPTKKSKLHYCCATVYHQGGWHSYRCERKGPKEHKGKHYCWQHDPKALDAKQKEKDARALKLRLKARDITAEGEKILKLLKCNGRVKLDRDFYPTRYITMTFTEAKKLLARLK